MLLTLTLVTLMTAQDTGTLRVTVTLDGAGVPRVFLLVSDNPATTAPRRVRTTADGALELALKPGSYTVESDLPVTRNGHVHTWTEMVEVIAGKETVLELTATNAAIEPAALDAAAAEASTNAGTAALLAKWRDAVVEIWAPTRHASGFLIDATGVIATSYHALGDASSVEVEITAGRNRFKVPGRVVASDRATGAAFVRIDAQLMAAPPIAPGCAQARWPSVAYEQEIVAIAAPMLAEKDAIDGVALRATAQAIFLDMRLPHDSAGGPVFAESGQLLGISALNEDEDRRIREPWVVPVERMCEAFAGAEKRIAAAVAPRGTRLPVEVRLNAAAAPHGPEPSQAPAASRRPSVAKLSSADFDISVLTPALARDEPDRYSPLADFAYWSEYVRDAPPVLLIRVSPQFEESFWKMLARGAAATQGMALPPLKSVTSNFLRMRAFCGDAEVAPIHPLIIERRLSEKGSIREGLYVFAIDAFGAHCPTVRLAMYSEKDPQKADTRTIDPQLFERLSRPASQH